MEIVSIISAIVSLLLGLGGNFLFRDSLSFKKKKKKRKQKRTRTSEKVLASTDMLKSISLKIEQELIETTKKINDKQSTVDELENVIISLTKREKQLKEKIKSLENIPLPALDHFENIIGKRERRDAKRDYLLFSLGVLVTTILSIIINLIMG